MDMEIARLSNVSWLKIPDRQAVSLRAVRLPPPKSWSSAIGSSTMVVQRVPTLDWPTNLFEDEKFYH